MIKAVIFDMDGVVVNTEPLSHSANKEMYKSLGITVPDEVYSTFMGNSDKNIVQKLKDLYPQVTLTNEELLEEKFRYYFAAFDASKDLDLMPGFSRDVNESATARGESRARGDSSGLTSTRTAWREHEGPNDRQTTAIYRITARARGCWL